MMREFFAPMEREASINSFCFRESAWPRTRRATPTQLTIASATNSRNMPLNALPERGIAQGNHHNDKEQQVREGVDHVGQAHQQIIRAPASITGDHPDRRADEQDNDGRDEANDHRDPRAIDDPAENIAAQGIGAQQKVWISRFAVLRLCNPGGGRKSLPLLICNGSCGAMNGAKIATETKKAIMIMPATAALLRNRRCIDSDIRLRLFA